MIRFGVVASVVSAAVALLIVGALSGDLAVVYISIGLAALALVMLVIGVAVWRDQVFAGSTSADGRQTAVDQRARARLSPAPAAVGQPGPSRAGTVQTGRPAPAEESRTRAAAAPGWPASPSREPGAPEPSALDERDRRAGRGRPDRKRDGRLPGSGGPRPAAVGRPGQAAGPEDRPDRDISPPAGRTPRRPETAESHETGRPGAGERAPAAERAGAVERAGAAEAPGRRPASTEPYPPVEQPEPADDPTRLAQKLGIGRQARPATGFSAPSGSSASRTRRPGTRTAEQQPEPAASGPAAPVRPETSAEAAAPESAPAPISAGPPAASRGATTDAGSASAPAVRETSGTAAAPEVAAAPKAPAAATGTPASATSGTAAAEGAAESAPAAAEAATPEVPAADGTTSQAAQDSSPADTQVLVVPGIARFHQADCILIRFLGEDDLQRMSREEAEAAGNAACRACRP